MHKAKLKNLSPVRFRSLIDAQKDLIILDCRTPEEFSFSRIENAINFNYLSQNFAAELEQYDPIKTYLVYCRSERRSIRTCTLMQNGGFKNVYNLDGGLIQWIEEFGEDTLDRSQL